MKRATLAWIVTGVLALMTAPAARAGVPAVPCFTTDIDACSGETATACGVWECQAIIAPSETRGSDPVPNGVCVLVPVVDSRECNSADPSNSCDAAELCDGISTECPPDDPNTLDGQPCDDSDGCTTVDQCSAGACVGGSPVDCTATGQCFNDGTCNPATGLCVDSPKPEGDSCTLFTGPVGAGRAVGFDVGCDGPDTCDGAGNCVDRPADDGTVCYTGLCTDGDTCQSGICSPGSDNCPTIVDDCLAQGCSPQPPGSAGTCSSSPAADGTPCAAGDLCITGATCQSTVCTGGTPVVCDSPGECEEAGGSCDSQTGTCSYPPAAEGTSCGDVDSLGACDEGDTCDANGDCLPNLRASGYVCNAATGDCDIEETCDGSDPACPVDAFQAAGFACGDPGSGDCTEPDTCAGGSDTCLPNHLECGLVTGGGTCLFDKYPGRGNCNGGSEDCSPCAVGDGGSACVLGGGTCDETRDLRLVFTPDVKLWPAHKLNATNAGQHRYNLFVEGTAGEEQTVTIEVPFPFVTQGANPVHAYDAYTTGQDGECFAPSDEIAVSQAWVSLADWSDGTQAGPGNLNCDAACGPLTCATEATCTFDVTFTVPESGMTYVQVHLDYGLKGVFADGNPCDTLADRYDPAAPNSVGGRDALEDTATQDGDVRIADGQAYDFAHFLGSDPEGGDTVHSANEFKRIAGVLGLATKSTDGSGVAGATVELMRSGKVITKTTTDADGFYALSYKHKGKVATYTVRLRGEKTLSQQIQLKANGWAEVNFDLSTATASSQFGAGAR